MFWNEIERCDIMKKFIIYLVRRRLKLRKYQYFRFKNQKREGVYYFTDTHLMKAVGCQIEESKVPLNWLLDDECKVVKLIPSAE